MLVILNRIKRINTYIFYWIFLQYLMQVLSFLINRWSYFHYHHLPAGVAELIVVFSFCRTNCVLDFIVAHDLFAPGIWCLEFILMYLGISFWREQTNLYSSCDTKSFVIDRLPVTIFLCTFYFLFWNFRLLQHFEVERLSTPLRFRSF